ncbi:MAG: 6-bladed beta-propeller [Bacteroidales bacterium]|nr:6-bladed beta-propeller [Bacteroidales bacterium]
MNRMYSLINSIKYLFVILLLSSCNTSMVNDSSSLPVIDIEYAINNIGANSNLSSYCLSIEYIPLETNEKSFVGYKSNVHKSVVANDSSLYYNDPTTTKIKEFALNGKYINDIGLQGRNRDEYVNIGDYYFDNGNLVILDRGGNKLLTYDDNGNFVSSLSLQELRQKLNLRSFRVNKVDDIMFVAGSSIQRNGIFGVADISGNILYIDSTKNLANQQVIDLNSIDKRGSIVNLSIDCGMFTYKDTVNILYTLSDTVKGYIYNKSDIEYKNRYLINIGEDKALADGSNLSHSIYVTNGTHYESDRFIFLRIFFGMPLKKSMGPLKILPLLFDKVTCTTFIPPYNETLKGYALNNDIDDGIPFKIDNMYGNKLYQVIDAETFINLAKKTKSERAKEIASVITPDSNPVVIIATLK